MNVAKKRLFKNHNIFQSLFRCWQKQDKRWFAFRAYFNGMDSPTRIGRELYYVLKS